MRVSDDRTAVIIADPPWPHANGSRTNSGKSPKYALMNLKEVAALGSAVEGLAGDHAVLYLWATTPHLPGAIDTMSAWGFTYRSLHVWRKRRVACGFWARSNAELLLIGERGRPAAPLSSELRTTILDGEKVDLRHSSKPDAVHLIAESLWPRARKIELFARYRRQGWECYGGDLGHVIGASGISEQKPSWSMTP